MSNFLKIFLLFFFSVNILFADSVTIQSTTSTRDSGLYKYLLPYYPNFRNVEIKVIAVGTGQAIMNAQNCDGNILIVHDEKREDIFMANNYGSERHNLMYNDFVIIGPNEDSARVYGSSSVLEAFSKIYENKRIFISRSDSSGTHAAEIKIWSQLGINPAKYSGKWYLESGQGMGPSLNIAIS